ncbi:MAG: hypothetical protein K6F85_06130 [Bacteroidales bacterium]|nr:hypothetical protein [Bacteroidales bacterium]
MNSRRNRKKNLIVSYKNLSDELKELFAETYPEGYKEHLQRNVKPSGEPIFVVPLETDDTVYMVKFEVKIDTTLADDDLDKDLYGDDIDKDEEFSPLSEALDKDEDINNHTERVLKHGAYEEDLDDDHSKKRKKVILDPDIASAFSEEEDFDSYIDEDDEEEDDDDLEPTDDDLKDIEDEYLDAEIPPLDATIPKEEEVKPKRGRKPTKKAAPAEPKKKVGRPATRKK